MNTTTLHPDDYKNGFRAVCEGMGRELNDQIVNVCYKKTSGNMKLSILKNTFKHLEENCSFHPTYKDFIQAAFASGYRLPVKANTKKGNNVGSCGLSLCDGSGWLSVEDKNRYNYVFRCRCSVGLGLPDDKRFCERTGDKHIYPIWDDSFENLGYKIINEWENNVSVDVNKSKKMVNNFIKG